MEEAFAVKTSNMDYPVPCLNDVSKNIAPAEKQDKTEATNNKTRYRLYYVYMLLRYII